MPGLTPLVEMDSRPLCMEREGERGKEGGGGAGGGERGAPVVGHLVDASSLQTQHGGVEECLGATEPLIADRDYLAYSIHATAT